MPSRNGSKYVARVQDLDDDPLHCHAYGHAWVPDTAVQKHDDATGQVVWEQRVVCVRERCGKVRTDFLNQHTYLRTRRSHYTEPDRFRVLEKTSGRSAYRREALLRDIARMKAASRARA